MGEGREGGRGRRGERERDGRGEKVLRYLLHETNSVNNGELRNSSSFLHPRRYFIGTFPPPPHRKLFRNFLESFFSLERIFRCGFHLFPVDIVKCLLSSNVSGDLFRDWKRISGVHVVKEVVAPPLSSCGGEVEVALSIHSGPSPSPSSSCEDNCTPPSKNCYRLVVLGSSRVGKTCIVARFLNNKFEESYTPTIEDFHRKLYRIRGEVHQLDILDTSGNHPFPAMRRLSFLTGDLFLLVFSMDSRESFEEVIRLREQILETKLSATVNSTGGRKRSPNLRVPMVIVGNKCDKDMKTVTLDEAKTFVASQDENCSFVETSAKRNLRIDDLFHELFLVSGLPLEMAPNHHKRINAQFGSPCTLPPSIPSPKSKKCTISIKRRLSDACGVVAPNVRRPSIRTDLMIMRTKTAHYLGSGSGSSKTSREGIPSSQNKCIIQ